MREGRKDEGTEGVGGRERVKEGRSCVVDENPYFFRQSNYLHMPIKSCTVG